MASEKSDVDWEQTLKRLSDASVSALDRRLTPAEERVVLADRARQLARPVASDGDAAQTVDLILFAVGLQNYGVETRYVREIRQIKDFSTLPGAPRYFHGVANLSGEILPLIDLRRLMSTSTIGLANFPLMVVMGDGKAELGIMADASLDLVRLAVSELLDPRTSIGEGVDFICRGVTSDALIVLDGQRLLTDERLFIDQSSAG